MQDDDDSGLAEADITTNWVWDPNNNDAVFVIRGLDESDDMLRDRIQWELFKKEKNSHD